LRNVLAVTFPQIPFEEKYPSLKAEDLKLLEDQLNEAFVRASRRVFVLKRLFSSI
jgi:hypothetical protein